MAIPKFAVLAIAATLAACGGGGGGDAAPVGSGASGSGGSNPTPPVVQTTESPIVTSVPVATYAVGSAEAQAFSMLNEERQRCGFGLVKQDTRIDQAAADHNAYWVNRAQTSFAAAFDFSHTQSPSNSGFTGVTVADRVAFRGYTALKPGFDSFVTEDIAGIGFTGPPAQTAAALGAHNMSNLFTSVYHVQSLFSGVTDVGIHYASTVVPENGYTVVRTLIDLGVPSGSLPQGQAGLRTFPCQGTSTVYATFKPSFEAPSPAPDLGNATIGTPIFLNAPIGSTLTVSSTDLHVKGTTTSLSTRLVTASSDPQRFLKASDAFLLPLAALNAGVEYEVSVTGTINGANFTKTWSFIPTANPF